MKVLSLVGAMVLIGCVDWVVLWLLRRGVRQVQRVVMRVRG